MKWCLENVTELDVPKDQNEISHRKTAFGRQYYIDQKPLFILTSCCMLSIDWLT